MTDDAPDLDGLIKTMAELQGIPLTTDMLPQARLHLEIAARMAAQLLAFDLDEREEPAPVFAS